MKCTAVGLMYVKDGVMRKGGVRQGMCARYVACWGGEKLVVVLWAGWIGKNVWRGDKEMIVGDMDGHVRSKFRESDVVCFEV